MSTLASETDADTLRHQLREAHATPQVDLVSVKWIPIIDRTGNVRQVGVEDLLLHAHEIKDLAVDTGFLPGLTFNTNQLSRIKILQFKALAYIDGSRYAAVPTPESVVFFL